MDEITAEYTVEEVVRSIEFLVRPKLSFGGKTDIGRVRENNEDKFEFFVSETDGDIAGRGHIFVVCDGMGGHEAGQIASELACKTFIDVYRNHPSDDAAVAARAGVGAANRFINDVARAVPSRKGMGTTLSALMVVQGRAVIAQVGDSRVYRLRGEELEQITFDHSFVEESVRSGTMTREEAERSPYRNVITRALGIESDVMPDLFELELEERDLFFLCSDGVTNHVDDEMLRGILMDSVGPSDAAWRAVGAALVGGGSDNATALVVRVDGLEDLRG